MSQSKFQKQISNPFLFRLFLITKLPMAFFAGIKVKEISNDKVVTTVKHKWINQNPFKSMYFAVLSMAAEMSCGALVLNCVEGSKPSISTLVVRNTAIYNKKAVGKITFSCVDGPLVKQFADKAIASGEAVEVDTKSIGRDEAGDIVAEFIFTWAMKAKVKG